MSLEEKAVTSRGISFSHKGKSPFISFERMFNAFERTFKAFECIFKTYERRFLLIV